ncbi:MAG: HAD-IA family hydrolase [Bdellovibrionaceae bacterium]|nr:HAD-IA family hydrolase [Pseudobdellovibrionaceae bacterium]
MIKHLVFDLDGTLADTLPEIHATADALAVARGFRRPTLEETRHGIGYGGRTLLCNLFGFQKNSPELQAAYDEFLGFYDEISGTTATLYPGVDQFLREWRGGLSIITNKPGKPAAKVIRFTGLDAHPWSVVIHGESFPKKKPDALPFTECFQRVGVAPEEVLVIGDSDADVLGAQACGAKSLAVSFGYMNLPELEALRPDGILHRYEDLPGEIRRLSR